VIRIKIGTWNVRKNTPFCTSCSSKTTWWRPNFISFLWCPYRPIYAWRQLVSGSLFLFKTKQKASLYFTYWRHISGIINKVYMTSQIHWNLPICKPIYTGPCNHTVNLARKILGKRADVFTARSSIPPTPSNNLTD